MGEATQKEIELDCVDCHFSKIVSHSDDKTPSERVREHGKETGHCVSVKPLEAQ